MEFNINYDQIATKLLSDNLLLTALELHLELIEAGKELSRLKEYFSNPGNFERQAARLGDLATSIARSHSQATLDSLDISRFSEDDGERGAVDERVAVLEFELRKARESISALRANLTEAATSSESVEATTAATPSTQQGGALSIEALKPHEQRALNFLVNEYLLRQGYRLTAVTFSEENGDQDFEDWDDVGLNLPRPPELPRLYREASVRGGVRLGAGARDVATQETQTEEDPSLELELIALREECDMLHKDLERERLNNEDLQRRLSDERSERHAANGCWTKEPSRDEEQRSGAASSSGTADQFEMLETAPVHADQEWTQLEAEKIVEESSPTTDNISEEISLKDCRHIPESFKKELYALLNSYEPVKPSISSTRLDIIYQLTELLPKLLVSLPSNRKEDLIPLIAASARLHSDSEQAGKLIGLLLALRKRPQEHERRSIIVGLCDVAQRQELIETHLLPQIWDLVGVKVIEKRLLAAETCSTLAPLTSEHVRKSQLLPLLQMLMVEAVEEEVKISVIQNLALLLLSMGDPDKYLQCEELCLLALKDASTSVQAFAIQLLLPPLAQWALHIDKLQSHLVARLLARISALANDTRSIQLINALTNLLPYLLICVGSSEAVPKLGDNTARPELSPIFHGLSNPDIFYGGEAQDAREIINALMSCLSEDSIPSWKELEWVTDKFIPDLYDILCSLTVPNEEIVISFVKLFHYICKGFGKNFTQQKIKPIFIKGLRALENSISQMGMDQDNEESKTSLMIIPVLLVSVLTTGDPEDTQELSDTLHHLLVSLPACNLSTFSLRVSLPHLCRAAALQETVAGSLSDASRHQRPVVRASAAQLALPCLASLQESVLARHLLPALSLLSNDHNGEVQEAAVSLFAELIATSNCKEAQMQSRAGLQAFLKDCPNNVSHTMSLALTRALARIMPACDPAFREDVVMPHLVQLSTHCLHGGSSQTRRMDLGVALVAALSAATQVPLSKHCIAANLIPALRNLETVCSQCLNAHHDAVSSWLREAESRCHVPSTPSTPTSPTERPVGSQLMQNAMSSASAVGRRSVEDVRQKVTNLLRKK